MKGFSFFFGITETLEHRQFSSSCLRPDAIRSRDTPECNVLGDAARQDGQRTDRPEHRDQSIIWITRQTTVQLWLLHRVNDRCFLQKSFQSSEIILGD